MNNPTSTPDNSVTQALEPCHACGALPCDWVNNPHEYPSLGALEPCPNPWCASHDRRDAEIFEAQKPIVTPLPGEAWAVCCPVCPISSAWKDTEAEAITAWNTRHRANTDLPRDDAREALAGLIEDASDAFVFGRMIHSGKSEEEKDAYSRALASRIASAQAILSRPTPVRQIPQWRCAECKNVVTAELRPDRCPSCKWCTCFAEVDRPVRPSGDLREALEPFAKCVEQIDPNESDEEWAKFRLLIGDYRRAATAYAALTPAPSDQRARKLGGDHGIQS